MSDEQNEQTVEPEQGKDQSPSGTEWPDGNISLNSQENTDKAEMRRGGKA
jgi:hypothetical protein